jgi:hypothetical protein
MGSPQTADSALGVEYDWRECAAREIVEEGFGCYEA